jgi:hypothetical protein
MEMFSVVPRVTDAQPRHGSMIAAPKSSLIIWIVPPARGKFCAALERKQEDARDYVAGLLMAAASSWIRPERKLLSPAVTF